MQATVNFRQLNICGLIFFFLEKVSNGTDTQIKTALYKCQIDVVIIGQLSFLRDSVICTICCK
jgi:hypothetical protein